MQDYYNRRAREYEEIYSRDDPQRQFEQKQIENCLRELVQDKTVLEVACGTGYWTQKIATNAAKILAVDYGETVLRIAQAKSFPESVTFIQDDAYLLDKVTEKSEVGFANFWISHVPKARLNRFFSAFHSKLSEGATIFFADNVPVKGIGGDLIQEEGEVDTYKLRQLKDGSSHRVIKNYYSDEELFSLFKESGKCLKVERGACFWRIQYKR